mmetsp:Transcript_41532/g.109353  ORF Transcript_41532/g.109353 Transcript_41532/m.109353 type:complete len:288 (+) Transcript_41532:117-980(+)
MRREQALRYHGDLPLYKLPARSANNMLVRRRTLVSATQRATCAMSATTSAGAAVAHSRCARRVGGVGRRSPRATCHLRHIAHQHPFVRRRPQHGLPQSLQPGTDMGHLRPIVHHHVRLHTVHERRTPGAQKSDPQQSPGHVASNPAGHCFDCHQRLGDTSASEVPGGSVVFKVIQWVLHSETRNPLELTGWKALENLNCRLEQFTHKNGPPVRGDCNPVWCHQLPSSNGTLPVLRSAPPDLVERDLAQRCHSLHHVLHLGQASGPVGAIHELSESLEVGDVQIGPIL